MKTKILSVTLGALVFCFTITGLNVFAAAKNISCGTGGQCVGSNTIQKNYSGGWIQFKGSSTVDVQPSYNYRIVATRTMLVGSENDRTIGSDDSGKSSDLFGGAGFIYSSPVSGRVYENVTSHFYYVPNGMAYSGGITTTTTY